MTNTKKILFNLKSLGRQIDKLRWYQLIYLLVLMIFTSLAEVISIGLIFPFLGALTKPQKIFELEIIQPIFIILGLQEANEILVPLTIFFCLASLLAGGMRISLLWATMRLTYATGADISLKIFRKTLYQDYSVHISRSSSEILNGILIKTNGTIAVIMNILSMMGAVISLILITTTLCFLDYRIAFILFGGFGVLYFLIGMSVKGILKKDSQLIANYSSELIKSLQEGLGGIKDIIIHGSQTHYSEVFRKIDLALRKAQGNINIVGGSPRYLMETLGMILIAFTAYIATKFFPDQDNLLPLLGAFALGAQKILPAMQQIYLGWTTVKGTEASLEDVVILLEQKIPKYILSNNTKKIQFQNEISLENINFQYQKNSDMVLENVKFSIPKGSTVGFVGTSGSGKTTLVDVIMGFLKPSEGHLKVDGKIITRGITRAWQNYI